MAIIVVSTQMGAGGPEIGMALAQKCGYRYVDQELLQDAGRRYGLAEERRSHLEQPTPTRFEHRVKQWIKRVAAMTGETANQRAAADFVRRDDTEKAGRMRYLYEVDINDPMLYELIINTERVSHDAAVEMINTVVRRPELVTTDASRRLVASRALASRVQVALATNPETRRYRITVEAQDGVVT